MMQQSQIECPKCKRMVWELEFVKERWWMPFARWKYIYWCMGCKVGKQFKYIQIGNRKYKLKDPIVHTFETVEFRNGKIYLDNKPYETIEMKTQEKRV